MKKFIITAVAFAALSGVAMASESSFGSKNYDAAATSTVFGLPSVPSASNSQLNNTDNFGVVGTNGTTDGSINSRVFEKGGFQDPAQF